MARSLKRQLDTPADINRAAGNEKRIGPLAHKARESCIDLTTVVSVEDLHLQFHGAGGAFHISQSGVRRIARTDKHSKTSGSRTISRRSSSRFANSSSLKALIPVRLPSG